MESMSTDEQQQFEDLMKQWDDEVLRQCAWVREEVKEIFLSHFMVDRHQKIIKQGEIKLYSLVTSLQKSNVSNPNENQSIKHYID
jgi:predicted ATP-dependent Lon-type protease